jgi:hypothetical protein
VKRPKREVTKMEETARDEKEEGGLPLGTNWEEEEASKKARILHKGDQGIDFGWNLMVERERSGILLHEVSIAFMEE